MKEELDTGKGAAPRTAKAVAAAAPKMAITRGTAQPFPSVRPRRAATSAPVLAGSQVSAPPTSGEPMPVSAELLEHISRAEHHAPHAVLGAHLDADGEATVRVLRPLAHRVSVLTGTGRTEMRHELGGIWVAVIAVPHPGHVPDYRVETTYLDGVPRIQDDPYRHVPTVGELELRLIATGKHDQPGEVLGAKARHYHSELGDSDGTSFVLWAPQARAVRVIGAFNRWDGTGHAMRSLGRAGVWELFIPGVGERAPYKYQVLESTGEWTDVDEPMPASDGIQQGVGTASE